MVIRMYLHKIIPTWDLLASLLGYLYKIDLQHEYIRIKYPGEVFNRKVNSIQYSE